MVDQYLVLNLCILGGLVLFLRDMPPQNVRARIGAVAAMEALAIGYLFWRYTATVPPFAWNVGSIWAWIFFAGEFFLNLFACWSLIGIARPTDHSSEADRWEHLLRQRPDCLPTVDLFVPTYNEKREILELTIRGARRLDYPKDKLRIWILDDTRRSWLKDLCAREGVGYLARPTNEHGKAGNLNYALERTDGEYILGIDADFILKPHFLYRTLGFLLYRSDIGLVQTPQSFRNPDPLQHNLFGVTAWTEEQNYFMTMVESGRDYFRNAFCVGSGWVTARSYVQEVGGFAKETMCEDLEMSYLLKSRGRNTLFLNEALAVGLAPESVPEYIKQRVRWCSGTIQHLYIPSGPLRNSRLPLRDRLFYFEPIVYWLTYPLVLLLFAAPLVLWFTGVPAMLNLHNSEVHLFVLSRYLIDFILTYWITDRKVIPPVAMVHRLLPAFHLTAAVLKSVVYPFGSPWKVTSKGEARHDVIIQWPLFSIFAALFVVLLAGMLMNLTGFHEVVSVNELTRFNILWTCYCLVLLALCALTCVELPRAEVVVKGQSQVDHGQLLGAAGALLKRLFT